MRFIATHTSIPVPRVLLHFQWGITGFIVMNRVRGIVLQDVWESYSMETKKAIIEQLAGFVAQLRSLRSPFGMAVCSVLGGCVGDYRLNYEPSGPFRDEAHMNLQLRYLAALEDCAEDVKSAHSRSHPIVFTHGDLAPRNIMVERGTITGILDWESAGWFPAHWEYCKARFASFGPLEHSWDPWITKCIPPFETESAVTMRLLKERWIPRAKV
jgi:aminoglycoside phosphotransferase (APT) family kinase protein